MHADPSEPRAKYADTLSAVVDDREGDVITRAGHDPAVMVPLDDYERYALPLAGITTGPDAQDGGRDRLAGDTA